MQRKLRVSCLAVVALCLAVSAQAEDAVTLQYKVKPGDQLIYRSKTSVSQTQSLGETTFETKIDTSEVSVRTYDEPNDEGQLRFQSENKRLHVVMESAPIGKYTYDSKSTERDSGTVLSEALNPVYDRLNGAIIHVTHNMLGEVVKVEGFKELLADVIKDNPLAAQFAGGGSDEAAKLGYQDQLLVLSEKPVKPGDSWERPVEVKLPRVGAIKGKQMFRYDGPDKVGDIATAKISISTEFAVDVDIDIEGAKVSGRIATTESTGTVHFDPERGRVVSTKTNVGFGGDLIVTAGDQTLNVGTKQTQKVEVELLDKLPE